MASSSRKAVWYNFAEDSEAELEKGMRDEPDETMAEQPKRNPVVGNTSDEDEGSAFEDERPAKRVKHKKATDEANIILPPCRQCTTRQIECQPNGWRAACKRCRKLRQTCSLAKAGCPSNPVAEHATQPPAHHQKYKNNIPEQSAPLKGPSTFRGAPSHHRVPSPVAKETLYTQISKREFQDLLKRLEDQDERIQELEAMQKANLKQVKKYIHNEIGKTENNLQSGLETASTRIDQERRRRKEEFYAAEQRCQDNWKKIQGMKQDPKERRDEQEDRHPTAQKFYDDFKSKIRKCSPSNSAGTVARNLAGIEFQQPLDEATGKEEDNEDDENEEEQQRNAILLMENQIKEMSNIVAAFKNNKSQKDKKEMENKKEQAPIASTSKCIYTAQVWRRMMIIRLLRGRRFIFMRFNISGYTWTVGTIIR